MGKSKRAAKGKTSSRQHEIRDEALLRILCRLLQSRGVTVRRENLSRGNAFRVKSGNCLLSGKDLIFVDKRLPAAQQLSLLLDMAVELQLPFEEQELGAFPAPMQVLLRRAAVDNPTLMASVA